MLADCSLYRHLPLAQESTRKWVSAHEKKVKNQNRQTEVVVIGSTDNRLERFRLLQLSRSIGRDTYLAQKVAIFRVNLKAITVDQVNYSRVRRYSQVPFIHVSDHVPLLVYNRKGPCDVCGGVDKKSPANFRREIHHAALRAVQ
jgi:hypothetical protein